MQNEDTRKRELTPLTKIRDNYRKIVLTLDTGMEKEFEGIEIINVVEWLITAMESSPSFCTKIKKPRNRLDYKV